MTQGLLVPRISVGREQWFHLAHYGPKHEIRYLACGKSRDVSEPTGHRVREIVIEGMVKWRPRDPSKIVLTDVEPLGAKKK